MYSDIRARTVSCDSSPNAMRHGRSPAATPAAANGGASTLPAQGLGTLPARAGSVFSALTSSHRTTVQASKTKTGSQLSMYSRERCMRVLAGVDTSIVYKVTKEYVQATIALCRRRRHLTTYPRSGEHETGSARAPRGGRAASAPPRRPPIRKQKRTRTVLGIPTTGRLPNRGARGGRARGARASLRG